MNGWYVRFRCPYCEKATDIIRVGRAIVKEMLSGMIDRSILVYGSTEVYNQHSAARGSCRSESSAGEGS